MARLTQKTRDDRPRPHVCQVCANQGNSVTFCNPADLRSHTESRHGNGKKSCSKCGKKVSADAKNLARHKAICNPDRDARIWYVCPWCHGTGKDSKAVGNRASNLRKRHMSGKKCEAKPPNIAILPPLKKMTLAEIDEGKKKFLQEKGQQFPAPQDQPSQAINESMAEEEEIQFAPDLFEQSVDKLADNSATFDNTVIGQYDQYLTGMSNDLANIEENPFEVGPFTQLRDTFTSTYAHSWIPATEMDDNILPCFRSANNLFQQGTGVDEQDSMPIRSCYASEPAYTGLFRPSANPNACFTKFPIWDPFWKISEDWFMLMEVSCNCHWLDQRIAWTMGRVPEKNNILPSSTQLLNPQRTSWYIFWREFTHNLVLLSKILV